ncbi:MAG: hypothetical protein AB1938_14775 [Myxococcota bacterium]
MISETATDTGRSREERELREELERLQAELRRAREDLEAAPARLVAAREELRQALESCRQRQETAEARLPLLLAEEKSLERSCASLEAQVKAKQEEDKVLAIGASRRDQYVDWSPNERKPLNPAVEEFLLFFIFALLAGMGLAAVIR